MKLAALVLGTAMSFSGSYALAYPDVGDQANYAGTYKKGMEAEQPLQMMAQVISYDAVDKEYDVKFDRIVGGVARSVIEDIDADKMFSPAMWTWVQANCVAKGGVIEDITVPAGTFSTCHGSRSYGTKTVEVWIGDVPFGVVKVNRTNSDPAKLTEEKVELQSYTVAP